jgi:hypothetical protein
MAAPFVLPEVVDGEAGEKLDCPQAAVNSATIARTAAQVTSRRRRVIRASLDGVDSVFGSKTRSYEPDL